MIPAWAGNYVGLPFVETGRDRAGLDCWGLALLVLREAFGQRDLPDFEGAYASTRDRTVPALFAAEMPRWKRLERPEPGAVVVFNVRGRPWHVGVMLDAVHLLSIDRRTASCIERLDSARWTGRIEGFYRRG